MGDFGPILLVGGGKMGSALAAGWLRRGVAVGRVHAIEPNGQADIYDITEVAAIADLEALPALTPSVIVLAVKPQVLPDVLPDYGRFAGADTVFLSIVAGQTLAGMAGMLGEAARIVRSMPNTPAAVGHGISVLCANALVSSEQRDACGTLLAAVGEVAWTTDETLMDAVTAVSGSGPAYVFLLVEALAEAGVAAGLPADLASILARATVAGSGALLDGTPIGATELRQNVTSPGGTTAAALEVLMATDGLAPLLKRAVAAAAARSRELAS